MFKNQLQELAQRSCFNLPSYGCVREGPDHAPRFRASVNFNGEIFESPSYCTTLRQAEHAAAEVALNLLSSRGPSKSLNARVLDETGIYKNLLQETAHRAGLKLPVYTTVRSGPGHVPIFSSTVLLAGMNFNGEPAKTKKQAEKNAAISAWSALKTMPSLDSLSNKVEQDQAIVARVLSNLKPKDDNISKQNFKRKDQSQARKRLVKGSSSINNKSSLDYQNWNLLDFLLDSALDSSNNKRKTSFVSLIPPPPPRTASKILPSPPTTLNKPNFPTGGSKSSLLDELHRKDELDWLGLADGGNKPDLFSIKEGSSLNSNSGLFGMKHSNLDEKDEHSSMKLNRLIGSSSFSKPYAKSSYLPRNMYSGGGFNNPQRIAPAVQIRSVIPVCAAPPPPVRPINEARSSATSSSSTATNIEAKVVTPELSSAKPTQLCSEFNKLLQL